MACDKCNKRRGHYPGCDAPTATGRPAPQRGRGRTMGPKDIPKHKCEQEEYRTVRKPGLTVVRVTVYFQCKTCHVAMGTNTFDERRLGG